MMGTYNGVLTTTRRTTHGARTATWNTNQRKITLTNLVFTDGNPSASSSPVRGMFGAALDVAWPSVAGQVLTLQPGGSTGTRTLYIEAWDAGGLFASQLAPITLGNAPVVQTITAPVLYTGGDAEIDLDDYFTSPDGHALTYSVVTDTDHIVTLSLKHKIVTTPTLKRDSVLELHGVSGGEVVITITGTDKIGLRVDHIINQTVLVSRVRIFSALVSVQMREHQVSRIIQSDGTLTLYKGVTLIPQGDVNFDVWRATAGSSGLIYGSFPTQLSGGGLSAWDNQNLIILDAQVGKDPSDANWQPYRVNPNSWQASDTIEARSLSYYGGLQGVEIRPGKAEVVKFRTGYPDLPDIDSQDSGWNTAKGWLQVGQKFTIHGKSGEAEIVSIRYQAIIGNEQDFGSTLDHWARRSRRLRVWIVELQSAIDNIWTGDNPAVRYWR